MKAYENIRGISKQAQVTYRNMVDQKLSPNDRLDHSVIGIINELAELGLLLQDELFANAGPSMDYIEELGDIVFYLTAYSQALGEHLQTHTPTVWEFFLDPAISVHHKEEYFKTLHRFYIHHGIVYELIDTLSNVYKKYKYYGTAPLDELTKVVVSIQFFIYSSHDYVDIAMSKNMEKLNSRYKAEFTPTESLERKDKCVD